MVCAVSLRTCHLFLSCTVKLTQQAMLMVLSQGRLLTMRNLKGKKVKMLPHCLFYRNDGGSNIGVIHKVVDVPHWNDKQGDTVVMVTDGAVMMPCYPHELSYLNNKPVTLKEAPPKPLG